MHRLSNSLLVLSLALPPLLGARTASCQIVEWSRQFGSDELDQATGVTIGATGHIYITGFTYGYVGDINAGGPDAFLVKFDPTAGRHWSRQIGTDDFDQPAGVSADGLGSVYIAGFTGGELALPFSRLNDAFVARYDEEGTLLWTRQLGTFQSDFATGVSADGLGNVYLSGRTAGALGGAHQGQDDAFISKYNDAGTLLWSRQLGTAALDVATGIATDTQGNAFIGGYTRGDLAGPTTGETDGFVAKYNPSGDLLWTRQFGTSSIDEVDAVATDSLGNVYLAGRTQGDLGGPNRGLDDVFVAKFDGDGTMIWSTNVGTSMTDWATALTVDPMGNVYLTGRTNGSFDVPFAGVWDAYVTMLGPDGGERWTRQFGTSMSDGGNGIVADTLGNVYLGGYTAGALSGANLGSWDVYLGKINIVPEAGTIGIGVLAMLGLVAKSRHKR